MTTATYLRRLGVMAAVGIAATVLLAMVIPAYAAAPPTSAVAAVAPASGSTEQWAYGGALYSNYTCTTVAACGSGGETSYLTWNIALQWVAIYTQTNVSASQTEYSAQTAIGISVAYGFTACVGGPPCGTESGSVSVHGIETANGSTNVTTGTTYLTAGGTPGSVSALAVMNAASKEAFNASGSFSDSVPAVDGPSISASFDVGGSESSSISFPTPIGLIPVSLAPGDAWNSSEAYTAAGTYVGGFSATATVNGTTESFSSWTPGTVTRSGTLNVSGNDTGTTTLYDNYTTPPTTVVAQDVNLNFTSGNFSASNGWLLVSSAVYDGILTGFEGSTGAVLPVHGPAPAGVPATSVSENLTSTESTYYAADHGFVGTNLTGNTSDLISGEPGGPSIHLHTGPEPVSVAQGQYGAITSSPSGKGFPTELVIIVAVVAAVVVVVAVVLLVRSRSARGRPPTSAPPTYTPGVPPPASPPSPPSWPGSP